MTNVQISEELFLELVKHHLCGIDHTESIEKGLQSKLDAMINRELYSKYKTAENECDKEKARKEYLDRKGIPQDFRW